MLLEEIQELNREVESDYSNIEIRHFHSANSYIFLVAGESLTPRELRPPQETKPNATTEYGVT